MRSIVKGLAAIALAATLPANAWAAHIQILGPNSTATAATGGGGAVGSVNGVQDPYYGSVGSTTHSADGWTNSASTTSSGNSASGTANLSDGTLHGYAASNPHVNETTSFSSSWFRDTLYFTNTTSSALDVTFRFDLDGAIGGVPQTFNPFVGGYSIFTLANCSDCANSLGQQITYANADHRVADTAAYLLFSADGIYKFAEYTGISNAPNPADLSYGQTFDDGFMTGYYQTTLSIPVGETSLGVGALLNLDCRGGGVCDFGHTGAIGLGPLPTGLSYTSASGTFLTALDTGPGGVGGVPEPATWAMMILGLGMIGAIARSRHRPGLAA